MDHKWIANCLSPERLNDKGQIIPAVYWFIKCEVCGCLITKIKTEYWYRAQSKSNWSLDNPTCI
jgi:hypothetical protein